MAKDQSPAKKNISKPTNRPERTAASGKTLSQRVAEHPVRWAVIAYAVLTVLFFLFQGALTPGRMVYGTDTMSAGVFFRTFYADFWQEHFRMPLWNPYIHGGLPFVDAMHGDIFYPAAILQILLPVTYALGLKLILHVFLAGVFMFLFLRVLGRSDQASFIGGLLYMWTPCLVSLFYPGHDGKIYVTALTPLAFLLVHRAVVNRSFLWFLGFGLVYALMILTAHVQMAYYAAWGLGAYFLFLLWEQYRFSPGKIALPVGAFVVAVALAIGAASMQWMAPYQYLNKYSQRIQHSEGGGYDWSSSWAMHSEEALSQLNPAITGANLTDEPATYWGDNLFKLNSEAVGVMAVLLAIVAFVVARSPAMWFFGGLSLIALLHALGDSTPVFRAFFEFVPGVKKFRAPSMICFLFAFSWVVMAARALDVFGQFRSQTAPAQKNTKDPMNVLMIVAFAYSAIAIIGLIGGATFMSGWATFTGGTLTTEKALATANNANYARVGFLIGLVVIWGLVGLFKMRRAGSLGTTGLTSGLAMLAVLPLWQFDGRFIVTIPPQQVNQIYGETPILSLIRTNAPKEPYRVLVTPRTLEDNYLALHGIEELSSSAMHGNHLLTHDNFVGRHDPSPALFTNPATRQLMNTVFIVAPQPYSDTDLTLVGQAQGLYLYRNKAALPRAAVFYQYEVEPDSNATLTRLREQSFPYRSRLLLDQPLATLQPADRTAAPVEFTPAKIIEWDVDRFVVEYTAERDGILWLSENYYPNWHATDENGQSLPIYRADYTFRAIEAKPGTHRVTFEFHNKVFSMSVWLSMICGAILLIGTVFAVRQSKNMKV